MDDFDFEKFLQSPSLEQLYSCRKVELQQIANSYKKEIVCGTLKALTRRQVLSALVNQKVFSSDAASKYLHTA